MTTTRRTTHRYHPAVINVPSKVGPRAWASCWRIMARRSGVFGVNETFLRSCKALYIALAAANGYGQYGVRLGPNPIFWKKKRWARVDAYRATLHGFGPKHHQYPGYNDARYATVVTLRDKRDGQEHTFICTHWVPEIPAYKFDLRWRDRVRAESIAGVSAIMVEHHNAGRVVWLMGDTNIGGHVTMDVPRFRWIRGLGIDKIGVALPEHWRMESDESDLVPAPTDHHHGVATSVVLSAPGR